MPKELTYSSNPTTDVVEHVAIGWTKGDCAQIGVIPGKPVEVTPDTAAGLWMDLDRDQINRLIRSLRTARDQAYGADA